MVDALSVLIVDDSLVEQTFLNDSLTANGYKVTVTSNGKEALEVLKKTFILPITGLNLFFIKAFPSKKNLLTFFFLKKSGFLTLVTDFNSGSFSSLKCIMIRSLTHLLYNVSVKGTELIIKFLEK